MFRAIILAAVLTASATHADATPSQAARASPPPPPRTRPPPVEEAEAQYTELVRRAEAGEAVDFRALRLAWLYGPAMKPDARRDKLPALKKAMFEAMREDGDPAVALARAREILDIVYVDLEAQKGRRQACELLGDEPCARRGRVVSFGLLKSVVAESDGASCATAWRVISLDEEYFVLRMLDTRLKVQRLVSEGGNTCDAMRVESAVGEGTFYFEVTDVLEARARRMGLRP